MPALVSCNGVAITSVPKISKVMPTGSSVLVELLTDQEMTSRDILVQGAGTGPPQAYVLALGESLASVPGVPIQVGDRVLLNGTGVFVPKYDDSPRTRLIVEIHNIRAKLVEEGRCCAT